MAAYVRFIVRHRAAVMLIILGITAFLASQLRYLHLEIGRRAQFPEHADNVEIQNRISDLFGGEAVAIIGVLANEGDVFTPSVLAKVFRITEGLRETTGIIEPSLFSIAGPEVKAVSTAGDGTLTVRPLMEQPPTSAEQIAELRATIENDKMLRENLLSADETATVIVADFDDRITDVEIAERVKALVAPERDATTTIALAGAPILKAALTRYTASIGFLFPFAVLVIALVHYEAFRTAQAMYLPLLTALLSVVWALGIMGLMRQPMDTWSAITPVVILAVAAGHAVQILKRYYEEYAQVRDTEEAVIRSIAAVGPVMLTAGLIASAGFSSLVTFGIASVRVFGLLLASGILSALVIEMTFTPACRCMLQAPKARELEREGQTHWLDRVLNTVADLVLARPALILLSVLIVIAICGIGAFSIQTDNSFRLWFSPGTQVRKDDALLNAKLPGTASLRILIEGEREGVLQEPEVLQAISDLQGFMEQDASIGGITSIADYVKLANQSMHEGDSTYYVIPDNRRLIAQYLLLYSIAAGPNGLSAYVDADFQRAVIRGLSKTDTAAFSHAFLDRTRRYAAQRFRGLPVTLGIAGGTIGVQTAMNDVVVHEKLTNMLQVSLIILLLSSLVLRSVVGGIFVLLPLGLAIITSLGLMGWTHTAFDMTTAAFTAMGISIGADFALYFIYRIREELTASASMDEAIRASFQTSGKAIFFVSSAVALGYMVLPLSGFSLWIRLGVLTAVIISASALATLTIVPSLALMLHPGFLRPKQGPRIPETGLSRAAGANLELTRFRGHLIPFEGEGVRDAQITQTVP